MNVKNLLLGALVVLGCANMNAQQGNTPNGTNANTTESGNIETPIPRDNFYDR